MTIHDALRASLEMLAGGFLLGAGLNDLRSDRVSRIMPACLAGAVIGTAASTFALAAGQTTLAAALRAAADASGLAGGLAGVVVLQRRAERRRLERGLG